MLAAQYVTVEIHSEGTMKTYADNAELQSKILNGVNKLADNVASTMGPRGRTVILQQAGRSPIITKDGVSVARFIDLEDPVENAAAQIIKQAAEETNSSAGDGTTTATVLARAIIENAVKHVAAGISPIEIKRGIDIAVEHLVYALEEKAQPITSLDDIINIATISANGDDSIGRLVGEAVDAIGKDGSITIKEGGAMETTLEVVEGFRFDSGLVSSKFITNERTNVMKYDKPFFLITDESIDKVEQILPSLELAARAKKPLIVVANEIMDEALAALIMNAIRGSMKVAAIKPPAYGQERKDILSDLALTVGATFFEQDVIDERTIVDVKLADLGQAESIESTKHKTVIVNGVGEASRIQERMDQIDAEIKELEDIHECERLQARIARLASSVAIIHVGGNTEVEMIEKKHRIEDALEAVRSAQTEGVIEGAGVALLRARVCLEHISDVEHDDQYAGIQIMEKVCEAPIRQILENAGEKADIIIDALDDENEDGLETLVYDLVDQQYVNPYEAGIVDPCKVTRCALENAASAVGALITTNYAVVETR